MNKMERIGIVKNNKTNQEIEIKGGLKVYNAIKSFSELGLITFSREQYFKSTYYTIHFFKPTKALRDLYNLGNEVLILCCTDGMRDFKSRTKDFIDYLLITKDEFKNRLDKITLFLIDDNTNIVSIVKDDRNNNMDTRLIVPFSLEELQHGIQEEDFQNRVREFLYERDLFGMASPLNNDNLFFGKDRSNLISEFYGKYNLGEQSGLFGLRRIGKTSVLNLLRLRIEREGGAAVYFDCSQYHHHRWNHLLFQIIDRVYNKYKYESSQEESVALSEKCIIDLKIERYSEQDAIKNFESDMKKMYENLGNIRILLIFDEIESISFTTSPSQHWKEENDALFFWQAIRSIIQTNNAFFSFIIAGVNPKCIEISQINGYDNPIFNFLNPTYMTLFDYYDIKNMISSIGSHLGINFEEEVFGKLVEDYGGHPFLTRQVCSKINTELLNVKQKRPTTVTRYHYEKKAKEYKLVMSGMIEQILCVLQNYYPEEFELLKKLALDGRQSFNKELSMGGREIQHLCGYCLIEKDNGEYFIRIKSIEEYLKNQFIYDSTLNSQSEKRARLNIRRDALENKLRTIIFYNMRTKYGKRAKEKLISNIKGTTTDKTQESKMRDVTFKMALEELYFSQLKDIILKEWKDYQNIFNDKVKFQEFFDLVNRSRGAGDHTRSLQEEDELMYNIAFKFFEKCLQDYE